MIEVDVWADVRCPWCWIGMRRLRRASALADQPVRVRRRSFLLEPEGPFSPGRSTAIVATNEWGLSPSQWVAKSTLIREAGSAEGLNVHADEALMFDSRPLHRLLKLAGESMKDDQLYEAWDDAFRSHFERVENLGDLAVLRGLASRWGLPHEEVERTLTGSRFETDVANDIAEARRLSFSSVPTVITKTGGRVSGSASVDELSRFLSESAVVK
ncbi:DsbA family protein [uncultured Agrococcus sp.]|uniref:DsbA family oxidoreductase n=1 Tax=uncultured Agrococcus sp. TaxID=382258 RepID=UPI0025F1727F|nr:DsbA family protein [uncultured Agrococcus sp.]